jgi:hypothetical protein
MPERRGPVVHVGIGAGECLSSFSAGRGPPGLRTVRLGEVSFGVAGAGYTQTSLLFWIVDLARRFSASTSGGNETNELRCR